MAGGRDQNTATFLQIIRGYSPGRQHAAAPTIGSGSPIGRLLAKVENRRVPRAKAPKKKRGR